MEARRIKNLHNINGTSIFIDSNVARFVNFSKTSRKTDFEDHYRHVLDIQTNLASIMAVLVEAGHEEKGAKHNHVSAVQFNPDRAW